MQPCATAWEHRCHALRGRPLSCPVSTTAARLRFGSKRVGHASQILAALGHEAELADPVLAMITDEQRTTFLDAIRGGADTKAAAAAAGIHRPRVYTLRDRDPEFAAEWAEARGEAAGGHDDDRPRVSYEHDLDRVQVGELVRALHRTGNLARAALEAGIELFPNRIDPKTLPREARNHLREALKIVAEAKKPKPPSQAAELLAAWNNNQPWPLDADAGLAADLRALGAPRAADDLERTLRGRAIVMARNQPRSTTPRAEPEDPSVF